MTSRIRRTACERARARSARERTPLNWYAKQNGFKRSLLSVYAVTELSVQARIGALQAMPAISEPLASIRDVPRSAFIKQWLTKETPGGVKAAAVRYLDDLGRPADLDLIKEELDNPDLKHNKCCHRRDRTNKITRQLAN